MMDSQNDGSLYDAVCALQNTVESLKAEIALLKQTRRQLEGEAGAEFGSNGVSPLSTLPTTLNKGDTAFVMLCSALVLFMTIPGLALYYSGMVRVQNVLATVMQSFSITCLITLLWLCFGYSVAFAPADGPGGNSFLGDGSRLWLGNMNEESVHFNAPNIPESVFCTYQLMFAIITPALICGAFADRVKYWSMLLFMTLWHLIVYCPLAHSMWHFDGAFNKMGVRDFAGGNVVHISCGIAGLVSALVVGSRRGFGKERFQPHNILVTFMGACMLWVGWMGFNGGSAYEASAVAGLAVLNTQISTSLAAITWMLTETYERGQPSVLGIVSGAISGLVAITPGAGFVNTTGAFFIGLFGGVMCFYGCHLKQWLLFDDALDAFGVHAIGGIYGGIMVGFFCVPETGDASSHKGKYGVFYGGNGNLLGLQLLGICVTICWSALWSFIIFRIIDATLGLRVSELTEVQGLDHGQHGESIVAGHMLTHGSSNSSGGTSSSVTPIASTPNGVVRPTANAIETYRNLIEMVPYSPSRVIVKPLQKDEVPRPPVLAQQEERKEADI